MNRSEEDLHRHEIAFRGLEIFEKRSQHKIVICGAGALGSNLLNVIARQGFTSLSLIDMDKVESHNVANQLFGKSDVGSAKVRACANKMFRELGVKIEPIFKELKQNNTIKLFKKASLIVDTFDNFESRKIVKDHCLDLPCVHAGMSDDGFSEIKWNSDYKIPETEVEQNDVCEYPLAVNLVHFTVCLLAEAIIRFIDLGQKINFDFTLTDLKVTSRPI